MTEQFRPERLTSLKHNSTLRSEGRFMAEQHGDANPPQQESQSSAPKPEKPQGPSTQADKIKAWEEGTGVSWDKTPADLRKYWLESGARPGPGTSEGEDVPSPDDYEDPKLKQEINRFNSGFTARKEFPQGRSEYIQNYINNLSNRIGDYDAAEAREFLKDLDNLLLDEEQKEAESTVRRMRRRGEVENETTIAFKTLLNSDAVLSELKKLNDKGENVPPDFNSPALKPLVDFIDKLDISETDTFHEIAKIVGGLKTEKNGGSKEDRQVSEQSRELLFEALYEKVIGRPDQGSPEAHYKIGSFQLLQLLDELDTLAIRQFKDNKHFSIYLSELQHVRQVMHDLNIALKYGEQYKEFILSHLSSKGLSFVHNELAGVNQAVAAWEKVSAGKVAESKEWFDQGDVNAIEEEVKILFTSENMVQMEKEGRKLMDWERDRALRIGKILFAGTQRMAMYSAFGNIPPMAATAERIASLPYEYIARSLMNFKVIAVRFFAGDKEAPKKFMEMILDEWGRVPKGKDGKPVDDKFIRLFGLDRRTIMLNHGQSSDPQSHSWRMQEMFFDPVRFMNADGRETSMYQYVNQLIKNYDPVSADPLLGAVDLRPEDRADLSKNLRDIVLGQRLYLSVFPRYGNFSKELKTEIWQKIALLKPSTIASLLPLDSEKFMTPGDKEIWKDLKLKLYSAELKRVAEDAEHYKTPKTLDELKKERESFESILGIGKSKGSWTADQFKNVLDYMGMGDLKFEADEQALVEKIIRHGIDNAEMLATASLPFSLAIDDAPNVAWAKTGMGNGGLSDADVIRLLASDQAAITEGWGAINHLVENPTQGAIEAIAKAVEKIGGVHGRSSAQNTMEPFIVAYLKFVSTDKSILFTPGAKSMNRALNRATSEIERYYRNSYASLDEEGRRDFLQALSQAGAISDNITKDGMLTQLDKIKDKTDSNQAWMLIFWIRTLVFLLGPIAGKEFIKMIMPSFK